MADKILDEKWRYPRFFTDDIKGEVIALNESDLRHAKSVLRMKKGDNAVICDGNSTDYFCEYNGEDGFSVIDVSPNTAEPNIRVRLFQCMPKYDKMDFIVQKAVELGVAEVIPIISARCISRPKKGGDSKLKRWNKIAYEAAKQCGRGEVSIVHDFLDYEKSVVGLDKETLGIILYECGGTPLNAIVERYREEIGHIGAIDIFIGSEGGFEKGEIEYAQEHGIIAATLGKRILRVETASLVAVSVLMNLTGNI